MEMKYILILALFIGIQTSVMAQKADPKYHFSAEKILDDLLAENKLYGEYLDNETMSSGIYHLKVGQEDSQSPHEFDEIYFVIAGSATLMIDGKPYPARTSELLFVPAKAEHKFVDIEEDLTLLVFFSKKEPKGNE